MGTRSQAEKMFSLITTIFTKLFGPKVGGTPVLLPRRQYYAVSGRAELAQNGGCQGSDGPQVRCPVHAPAVQQLRPRHADRSGARCLRPCPLRRLSAKVDNCLRDAPGIHGPLIKQVASK